MHDGIIILEGPDASGKTTLANNLRRYYGLRGQAVQYLHLRARKNVIAYQTVALAKAFAFDGITILDRHWLSEEIYGAVYRSRTPASFSQARTCFDLLLNVPTVYVLCTPEPHAAVKSFHDTVAKGVGQLYKPDDRLLHVAALYRAVAGFHPTESFQNLAVTQLDLIPRGGLVRSLINVGGFAGLSASFPHLFASVVHNIFVDPVVPESIDFKLKLLQMDQLSSRIKWRAELARQRVIVRQMLA